MSATRQPTPLNRDLLLGYFLAGAKAREDWKIGMELEKMGRTPDGAPIPFSGADASVRRVLELLIEKRGGDPVYEADQLIGVDAPWGTISLEPGGQVEWSSRPRETLTELRGDLDSHLAALNGIGDEIGVRWLELGVDPDNPVEAMHWMPKARYKIMRSHLGRRGRLAHRMMTQSASVQCAFDYADPEDWRRKFRAAALLAPVATALFANSSRIDGAESGYRSYRQRIWTETDPDRCGLTPIAFDDDFSIERWLDWILSVPTLFLHRARGLAPSGGEPFGSLLQRSGCEAVKLEDWETHVSTIFTEVRCYTYLEVRSADLLPDALCFAVPAFSTGILYDDPALGEIPDLLGEWVGYERWQAAMQSAARSGLDGEACGLKIREVAERALRLALEGLERGSRWVGDAKAAVRPLENLVAMRGLEPR